MQLVFKCQLYFCVGGTCIKDAAAIFKEDLVKFCRVAAGLDTPYFFPEQVSNTDIFLSNTACTLELCITGHASWSLLCQYFVPAFPPLPVLFQKRTRSDWVYDKLTGEKSIFFSRSFELLLNITVPEAHLLHSGWDSCHTPICRGGFWIWVECKDRRVPSEGACFKAGWSCCGACKNWGSHSRKSSAWKGGSWSRTTGRVS